MCGKEKMRIQIEPWMRGRMSKQDIRHRDPTRCRDSFEILTREKKLRLMSSPISDGFFIYFVQFYCDCSSAAGRHSRYTSLTWRNCVVYNSFAGVNWHFKKKQKKLAYFKNCTLLNKWRMKTHPSSSFAWAQCTLLQKLQMQAAQTLSHK